MFQIFKQMRSLRTLTWWLTKPWRERQTSITACAKKMGPRNAKNVDSCSREETNGVSTAPNRCVLSLDHVIREKFHILWGKGDQGVLKIVLPVLTFRQFSINDDTTVDVWLDIFQIPNTSKLTWPPSSQFPIHGCFTNLKLTAPPWSRPL